MYERFQILWPLYLWFSGCFVCRFALLSLTVLADNISSANFDLRRQVVKLTGIMEISSFRGQITRGDFAKMLVKGVQLPGKSSFFQRVGICGCAGRPSNAVYIRVAASQGWMSGYLGGNFKPEEPVLYKDAVKAVLTLLGYTDEDFTGEMASSRISKFNHLELNEDVSCQADEAITETDCMNIFIIC